MDDIDNELTVAQKLLGSIKKKFKKNKMILWFTIGILAESTKGAVPGEEAADGFSWRPKRMIGLSFGRLT
jgi:hypothetical protein